MKTLLLAISLLFGSIQCQFPVTLENPFSSLNLSKINSPTSVTSLSPHSDAFLIASQDGTIYMFDESNNATLEVFYKLSDVLYNETIDAGLLSITFESNSSALYMFYTAQGNGTVDVRVSFIPYSFVSNQFGNLTLVIDIPQLSASTPGDVLGGGLGFGPDGYLYIGVGDAEVSYTDVPIFTNNSQDATSLFGKILRIQPLATGGYTVPATNPFVRSSMTAPEIYALGLRQPFRFSWDSQGNLWCPDVGGDVYEEINIITSGANYGWPVLEGIRCNQPPCGNTTTQFTSPIYVYNHNASLSTDGVYGEAIIGGYVYEGDDIPAINGQYIFGDFIRGALFALEFSETNFSSNSARLISNSSGMAVEFLQVDNRLWVLSRVATGSSRTSPTYPRLSLITASNSTSSSSSNSNSNSNSGSTSSSNSGSPASSGSNSAGSASRPIETNTPSVVGADSSSTMIATCLALTIAAVIATF